ncbi:MAG: type II toxin-antitoxin system HicB family antitoxin [Oscillospiraceae bacterium]
MKYEIILYWSEADDAFVAEIPELSGCMADGKTMTEALHNVQIVAQEWIGTARELGREIPVPVRSAIRINRQKSKHSADRGGS